MAVYQTGGGGFLGSLGKIAQIGAMFVPGMQPWAAAIGAASSLANGDPAGAALNVGMGVLGNKVQAAQAAKQPAAPNPAAAVQETAPIQAQVNPAAAIAEGRASLNPMYMKSTGSLNDTFANILRDPDVQTARIGTPWNRAHFANTRRMY
jgi:hypothetical protein